MVLCWGNLSLESSVLVPALGGPKPTILDIGLVSHLGVFQLGLAYALFKLGLRETPAVEASLLILLEPVLNPVWTFILAGEQLRALGAGGRHHHPARHGLAHGAGLPERQRVLHGRDPGA